MDERIINIAAEILKITADEAANNSKPIPEINGAYFWSSKRGGKAVIINSCEEKLTATSSVSFDKHLQAFIEGKRN